MGGLGNRLSVAFGVIKGAFCENEYISLSITFAVEG